MNKKSSGLQSSEVSKPSRDSISEHGSEDKDSYEESKTRGKSNRSKQSYLSNKQKSISFQHKGTVVSKGLSNLTICNNINVISDNYFHEEIEPKKTCGSFKIKKISTHREKGPPQLKIIGPDKTILSVKEIELQEDSVNSNNQLGRRQLSIISETLVLT